MLRTKIIRGIIGSVCLLIGWLIPIYVDAMESQEPVQAEEYAEEIKDTEEMEGIEGIGDIEDIGDIDSQTVWDLFSLDQLIKKFSKLQSTAPGEVEFPAKEVFTNLFQGRLNEVYRLLATYTKELLIGQKGSIRGWIAKILLVGIGAAVFRLLTNLFPESKVTSLGEYTSLLVLLSLLLVQYKQMTQLAEDTLLRIGEFIPIFVPAFIASIGIACGMKTAVGYQAVLMGIAYAVVKAMIHILLPLVYVYLLLSVMDAIWQDDRMGMTMDLVKKGIEFSLKVATRVVAGIGLVQALILPVMDSLQGMAMQKMISILPGLGNLSDQVFKMFIGSCVLIKNCLGIFMVLLLLAICMGPLIQLLMFVFVLRGTAALLGILGEKQIVKCMGRVSEACMLLGKIVTAAILMLFLLLSIACYLKGCV